MFNKVKAVRNLVFSIVLLIVSIVVHEIGHVSIPLLLGMKVSFGLNWSWHIIGGWYRWSGWLPESLRQLTIIFGPLFQTLYFLSLFSLLFFKLKRRTLIEFSMLLGIIWSTGYGIHEIGIATFTILQLQVLSILSTVFLAFSWRFLIVKHTCKII